MATPVVQDEVIRRAQRGDQAAFALIVDTYQTPIFNYILRTVGDRGLAEDLTQEVFLRVYQSLPRFSFRSKFTTWLFQIAKNRMLDELRTRERRPPPGELPEDGELHAVDPPADRAETLAAIWRAVEALPLDLKMSLLLRDISGFTYEEISDILETTLATVKWRIFQARETVAQSVAAEGLIDARPAPRRRRASHVA
jgi:RNA polymerase sigma-70 factor (ECF subfamily)